MWQIIESIKASSPMPSWCLIYPAYSVAVPRDHLVQATLAYPVAQRDAEFALFISQWIRTKDMDGTLRQLYDHWILGLDARTSEPREALVDDWLVLGNRFESAEPETAESPVNDGE